MKEKHFMNIKVIMAVIAIAAMSMALFSSSYSFAEGSIWDEGQFAQPSDEFNPETAKFALGLSTAAYGDTPEKIESLLAEYGFINDTVYDSGSYEKAAAIGSDEAGYSFASKKITVNGKEYTLVAVVIRGTHDNSEWLSNFNINNSGKSPMVHEGFQTAKASLEKNLNGYIKSLHLKEGDTKVLITGHSRGAAVANLLAASLSEKEEIAKQSNIYAYTFATPNTVILGDENYYNIFNAVISGDLVSQIPLESWGYGRYGVTYCLSSGQYEDKAAAEKAQAVINELEAAVPTLNDFYAMGLGRLSLKDKVMNTDTKKAHKTSTYQELLNQWGPSSLKDYVTSLQLQGIPNDNYA